MSVKSRVSTTPNAVVGNAEVQHLLLFIMKRNDGTFLLFIMKR
jgi:hypothetical protein